MKLRTEKFFDNVGNEYIIEQFDNEFFITKNNGGIPVYSLIRFAQYQNIDMADRQIFTVSEVITIDSFLMGSSIYSKLDNIDLNISTYLGYLQTIDTILQATKLVIDNIDTILTTYLNTINSNLQGINTNTGTIVANTYPLLVSPLPVEVENTVLNPVYTDEIP